MGLRPGCREAEGAAHKRGETSGALFTQEPRPWLVPVGGGLGTLVSCRACWQRQLVDLVTDSSEEMNEAIVHLV